MARVAEDRLDALEESLKEKMSVKSGFADDEVMVRELEAAFRFFDTDNSGFIDQDEFFAAMTQLNFVGVQRELEALFNRYDDDCSGTLEYGEFAKHVFGLGDHVRLDPHSRSIVERVKAKILERGGASGIHGIMRILRRMDTDGSHNLDRVELVEGLADYGITDLDNSPGGDVDKLMQYFDRDKSGRISIEEFVRGLRGNMSQDRKLLVREAYNRLDKNGDGTVTIEDIMQAYDASHHPDVAAGRISEMDAAREMMNVFEGTAGNRDGIISWEEFLDYYKDISSCIDDDDYFELMIRNAWHISGGEGAAENTSCRRVLVTHSDGSQEVCEIQDDLGIGARDMEAMRRKLEEQGVTDIAELTLSN